MFSFFLEGKIGEMLAPVRTPIQQLHGAIEDGINDKAMRLMHEEGVDWNAPDPSRDGALPIHTACQAGNMSMIDYFFQCGADVNAQDKNGNIPLHAAAKGTRIDIVKYLVDKGADVARRNKHRQTPYDVATNHIIRQYLLPLQFRAEPQPEPTGMAAYHNPDAVRDYSNLPPPPTFVPPQLAAPQAPPLQMAPSFHGYTKPSWTDSAVIRPIAPDGFHSSAGDPALAAKYGHIKQEVRVAPPPVAPPADGQNAVPNGYSPPPTQGGQQPRASAPPPTYSAFSAYGGRPMPRYVTYNAAENTGAPMAYAPPPPMPQAPIQQYQAPIQQQQQQQSQIPRPHSVSPPPTAYAPPYNPYSQGSNSAPPSGGIPTLPNPNAVKVFRPPMEEDDDAIALDSK